ncbi:MULTISPECIES: arginase family protein [unclassified Lysobacter]|uniref:arginase family protein n=1 Tax=unclassified Lysobacter TaxID=2635362 RepID=UPI001BE65B2E|nr:MULTISPECIES: arginase family protein [unclassified Lysobacter]MBT2745957.1 arginase family protein [Lysobacter sp. ISL-42]MBT2752660.1 arginase family protein [Lysobacter sp. ISL-50]MBT2777399.1 arginase family protein [Lysobacter sp. ISL-54]MBT2783590.1 arginase family protein [Lysobacter sp. ISL-52]
MSRSATSTFPRRAAIAVIDAPSNLGLRPPRPGVEPGVRRMPDALRATGLVQRLRARDAGRVEAQAYSPEPDRTIGFRNGAAFVLAERVMPAVDSPNPGGLDFEQFRALLAQLLANPKAVGVELTIFDPDLDPDRRLAKQLAEAVAGAFEDSGRWPSSVAASAR